MIVTRRLEFDAGHRLVGHESKCKHLHGHRYVADISCGAGQLDTVGRVVDFSVIKELVGGWIDRLWDHNMILNPKDPLLYQLNRLLVDDDAMEVLGGKEPFIMPEQYPNPTAENMSIVLLAVARELLLPCGIHVPYLRLYETPNCWADCCVDRNFSELGAELAAR